MDNAAKLSELIESKNGMVKTKDTESIGIPRQYLSLFVEKGRLQRVAHGVYLSPCF